jgi:predicted PurR-regulated permease PerM
METLSFAFGVLSAVGLLFVITIVLGAVKVLKQQKEIEFLNKWVNDFDRNVWQALNRNEEEIHRQLNEKLNETTRYIDSRLDKLEQRLTSKQTLKG